MVQRLVLQVKVQQLSDDVQYQVIARGEAADTSEDAAVLRDYFNLQACLKDLCQEWSDRDERFNKIHAYFPGRHRRVSGGSHSLLVSRQPRHSNALLDLSRCHPSTSRQSTVISQLHSNLHCIHSSVWDPAYTCQTMHANMIYLIANMCCQRCTAGCLDMQSESVLNWCSVLSQRDHL